MSDLHHNDCKIIPCTCGGSWPGGRRLISVTQLSASQRTCLRHFVEIDERGAADGFKFGAATLTSLRQLGLIEKFRGYPWAGAKQHNMWRATNAGRAVFPDVTFTRDGAPLV